MKIKLNEVTLKQIGSNKTVLATDKISILFSYESPVAAKTWTNEYINKEFHKYSPTTSKHIKQWLYDKETAEVLEKDKWEQLLSAPENY